MSNQATATERYNQRRGRSAMNDAIVGLIMAVQPEVNRWLDGFVADAAKAAVKGASLPPFPSPEPWVRWTLLMQLMRLSSGESKVGVPGFFEDERLLSQLVQEPPLPVLRCALEAAWQEDSSGSTDTGDRDAHVVATTLRRESASLLTIEKQIEAAMFADDSNPTMLDEYLDLARQLSADLSVAAPKGRKACRPKDSVFRAFREGVVFLYGQLGLGIPTVDDLTDLAIVTGFDRAPTAVSERRAIRDRWRKREKLVGVEITT